MSQLAELEAQTDNIDLVRQFGALLSSSVVNDPEKISAVYRKAVSLGGWASTLKLLAESLRVLVGLERQALNLDDANAGSEVTVADRLRALAEKEVPPHASLPAYCDLGGQRQNNRAISNQNGL